MSELTQEQRVRLAEMAGYILTDYSLIKDGIHEDEHNWQPDKEIAQAMEVLEGYPFFSINKLSSLSKSWYDVEVNGVHVDGMNLPMTICQAILKAEEVKK